MKRWQLGAGILTSVTVALILIWMVLHQKQTNSGYGRLGTVEAKTDALLERQDRAEYEWGGAQYVLVRREGQSVEEFRQWCEQVVFFGLEAEFCWESDCVRTVPPIGPYHIKLCSSTQEGLDELVEDYCSDPSHDCDECPD